MVCCHFIDFVTKLMSLFAFHTSKFAAYVVMYFCELANADTFHKAKSDLNSLILSTFSSNVF